MAMSIYSLKIKSMNGLRQVFGDQFIMARYRNRSVRKYQKAGIVFIHIPKSAGTSVCDSLYGSRVGHFTLDEMKQSSDYASLDDLPRFSIVRDPAKRLYSSYKYARNGGGADGSISPDPAYESPQFRNFSAFLSEWLQYQELHDLDRIFWPQSSFLCGANSSMDFVGKVEEMELTEKWLQENYSSDVKIPHLNRGQNASASSGISAEDMRIIRDVYETDYSRFSYS
jgi:hypothetical protein